MAETNANTLTSEDNSTTSNGNPMESGGASGFGGGIFGDPLAPAEGYEYDFASGEQSMRTPFDPLLELPGIDGLEDVFGSADASGGGNPFGGGGSDSPPTDNGDSDTQNNPFTNPLTESDDTEGDRDSGGNDSSFNGNQDLGVGNDISGSGNYYLGDSEGTTGSNNSTDGNGNFYFGNDNESEGNGNWNFGSGNQTEGNGNWYLSGEGNPLENNPLSGGESENIPSESMGGNNPIFAGGSSTPSVIGDGEMPATAENPTGNNNVTTGNGNWYFSDDNTTNGNGNWNFGNGNTTSGNGNWNLGEDNIISGNGNRPSGSGNTISGNGNQPTGSNNDITGNRFSVDDDNLTVYGNGDRYFTQDEEGNVDVVSDESASDANYTFDFAGLAGNASDAGNEATDLDENVTSEVFDKLPVGENLSSGSDPFNTGDTSIGSSELPFPSENVGAEI